PSRGDAVMRSACLLTCLLAVGCGAGTEPAGSVSVPAQPGQPDPGTATQPVGPADEVPDLRTRMAGSDWPTFLGPTGASIPTEKGHIAPGPEEGLRKVWSAAVGNGYVAPAISKGRLFLFDRGRENLRLRCLNSETGAALWQFEYPSDFQDMYGYDNGPRATPVVDGGRVYIYGP